MRRSLLNRALGLLLAVAVAGLASATTSCGGGGGVAAKDMVLLEFLFVDRSLNPLAPTGTQNLPRNAQILLVFSELVDPGSVNPQTIQVRFGPSGQSVPQGSYSVDGNTVRFDPTVTAQGQPNPFGFLPVTQYLVDIPNFEEQPNVVRNLDDDPNLETFFTTFVTSDGYIRELVPPEVVRVYSIPDRFEVNPLTGQWPGNGLMAFEFTEALDPASFILGGVAGVEVRTSI
ncbi:MAG: Ig-like domain-containing protein, partial [Planctomycetota bacterium]